MSDEIPTIALTIGDPAGIGPEIVAKALADDAWFGRLVPVVVGSTHVMREVVHSCRLPLEVRAVDSPAQAKGEPGYLDLIDCAVPTHFEYGLVSAECGRAAVAYIEKACALARLGRWTAW